MGRDKPPIRNRIRELRLRHGDLTQQQLAERVGVSRQTLLAIETNKYSPSLLVAFRIAHEFGVRLDDVFQYEPSREGDGEQTDRASP